MATEATVLGYRLLSADVAEVARIVAALAGRDARPTGSGPARSEPRPPEGETRAGTSAEATAPSRRREATRLPGVHPPVHVVTLNPEIVVRAERDSALKRAILSAEVVVADGIGVVWAAIEVAGASVTKVPGIDLAEALVEDAANRGKRVYLLGSTESVVSRVEMNLKARFPRLSVVGARNGFFPLDDPAVVDAVASASPDLVVVGMGCPRQELWIAANKGRFPGAILIGVGGSLDVWAGRSRRAPVWARRIGLEWLWRAIAAPARFPRLWYLIRFVWLVFRAKLTPKGEVS